MKIVNRIKLNSNLSNALLLNKVMKLNTDWCRIWVANFGRCHIDDAKTRK